MKKEYVAAFLRHKENMRFSAGLFAITGFKQVYVPVKKNYKGESSYSMLDRLTSGIDAITSFSVKPLKYLFFLGLFSFILSSIAGVALVFSKLYIDYFSGWLSTITLVILFGSINLMALGVVGIYISRIYLEAKDRPKYHIRRIYGKS
jgi:putative glycosyltransferase